MTRGLAVVLGVTLVLSTGAARADAVGMLDPELAQICGGSAHAPNCGTEHVGMACCGGFVVLTGMVGLGLSLRGRREKS